MNKTNKINIIGGGLAGCEAAYQISKFGIKVDLYEMRPKIKTEAHKTKFLAELVCSNSFRSDDKEYNAVGVLHEELRIADSLIMKIADLNKIPAGSALAVDRDNFAIDVNEAITNNKNIITIPHGTNPVASKSKIFFEGKKVICDLPIKFFVKIVFNSLKFNNETSLQSLFCVLLTSHFLILKGINP